MKQKLIPRIGKITPFSKSKLGFSDVFIIEPEDLEKSIQGILYFVIEIASPSPKAKDVAQLIVQTIEEEYYKHPEKESDEAFELALKKANEVLGNLVEDGEISWVGHLNLIGGVLKNNHLILTATGNGEAYLIREDNLLKISEGLFSPPPKPDPLKTFINITLGELLKDDVILLTTPGLMNYLSPHRLKTILKENSAPKATQIIENELKQESALIPSLIILEFKTEEEISMAPVSETTLREEIEDEGKEISPQVSAEKRKIKKKKEAIFLKEKLLPFLKDFLLFVFTVLKKTSFFIFNVFIMAIGLLSQLLKNVFSAVALKIKEKKSQKTLKTEPSLKKQDFVLEKIFSSIKEDLIPKFLKLKSKLKIFWRDLLSLKLEDFKEKSFKTYLLLFVISLTLLFAALGITAIKRKQVANLRYFEGIFQEAQLKITQAESALIPQDEIGKKEANSLIKKVRALLSELQKAGYKSSEVALLFERIEKISEQIEGIVKIEPRLLVDFSELEGKNVFGIFKINNDFYTVDKEKAIIFKYKKDSLKGELVFQEEQSGFNCAHVYLEKLLLLRNQILLEFNEKSATLKETELLFGTEIKPAIALDSYRNYLYLLSPQENQIYRSSKTSAGFSKFFPYIATYQSFDIRDAKSFTIANFVYVLKNNGQVLKLAGGRILKFELKNLLSPFKNPTLIYSTEGLNYLYIGDPENKRIVVFDLNGNFVKQFKADSLSSIKGFFVDKKTKEIYFISNNKLYSFKE